MKLILLLFFTGILIAGCNSAEKPDDNSVMIDTNASKNIPAEEPNAVDTNKIKSDSLLKADSIQH